MPHVRLYLRLGDRVYHSVRGEWGTGAVVEEMTSTIDGGTCLVRILFEDGCQRTFSNDLDSETCCYFFGIRRDGILGRDFATYPDRGPSSRPRVVAQRRSLRD